MVVARSVQQQHPPPCTCRTPFHDRGCAPLQDEVTWETFCRQLLDGQEDASPGRLPNFDAPATLREQLGLPSFRALCQVRRAMMAAHNSYVG
jgi:hypothetical protein